MSYRSFQEFNMISINSLNVFIFILSVTILFASKDSNSKTPDMTPQYLESLLNSSNHADKETFQKILYIPNVDLVDPKQRKSTLELQVLFNGLRYTDLLMRPGQDLNPNQLPSFNGTSHFKVNKWKIRSIPYYITKSLYADNETQHIQNAIDYHNQVLGQHVIFRPYQDGDQDYVIIYNGGCGCYSNLGHVGGPQAVSFTPVCMLPGGILHILHHILGIEHEINRSDRDDYLQLDHKTFPEAVVSQYQKYSADSFINIGKFEYTSVMAFPTEIFFFVVEDGYYRSKLMPNPNMTEQDILRVKVLYPLVS